MGMYSLFLCDGLTKSLFPFATVRLQYASVAASLKRPLGGA